MPLPHKEHRSASPATRLCRFLQYDIRRLLKAVIDRNLLIQRFFIGASVRPGLRGSKLPEEIAELSHYEMSLAVGEAVREHYQNHRRCRLIGYEFRQSLDPIYRFDTEGEYLGRVDEGLHPIQPKGRKRLEFCP